MLLWPVSEFQGELLVCLGLVLGVCVLDNSRTRSARRSRPARPALRWRASGDLFLVRGVGDVRSSAESFYSTVGGRAGEPVASESFSFGVTPGGVRACSDDLWQEPPDKHFDYRSGFVVRFVPFALAISAIAA